MRDMLERFLSVAKDRDILSEMELEEGCFHLMTLHRPQNTENKDNLRTILDVVSNLNLDVVFPAHPRTANAIKRFNLQECIKDNVKLVNPLSYPDFIALLLRCKRILTDSGGIQKEAYLLDKPCITLREETEWPETVEDGWNTLVDSDKDKIINAINSDTTPKRKRESFGDGKASDRVAQIIRNSLN